jgi:cell wall-associated NlpC family hydrolase
MSPAAATKKKPARARRAARTGGLQLTNPHLKGPEATEAQQLLADNPYGNFQPGAVDGEFGPMTAAATKQAKWALGYPAKACDGAFGPHLAGFLRGKPLPPTYQARRNQRLKHAAGQASVRAKIVQLARWGIQNELQIHYQQLRPVDGLDHPQQLPLHTDCSGFVTLCYKWAGSKEDPNGGNFTGAYTGTMLTHCRHIPKSAAQPGDLVVWGAYPGHHVALVLEPGSDPLLCSHGQEKGPLAIKFSVESAFQSGPATWLACLP